MSAASLYEVFSSVQGEATRVGERHLFVRLAGCDLECSFCDTPASRRIPSRARIFLPGGVGEEPNPVDVERLLEWVARLDAEAGPHHALAITGGEPLLFPDFVRGLAEGTDLPVLLETGGHRPDELAAVLDCVDIIMADVKLASSAGFATDRETTRRFLQLATRKECAVKVVASAKTTPDEVRAVASLIGNETTPLILQPVTGSKSDPPSGDHMLALQRTAMRAHRATRVIPQTHKSLHVR